MDVTESIVETPPSARDKVVLFADLLGFARLTEQWDLDLPFLRNSNRIDANMGQVFKKKNALTHAFTEFHTAMQWALRMADMKHASTAISFSDSAFVATALLH